MINTHRYDYVCEEVANAVYGFYYLYLVLIKTVLHIIIEQFPNIKRDENLRLFDKNLNYIMKSPDKNK